MFVCVMCSVFMVIKFCMFVDVVFYLCALPGGNAVCILSIVYVLVMSDSCLKKEKRFFFFKINITFRIQLYDVACFPFFHLL